MITTAQSVAVNDRKETLGPDRPEPLDTGAPPPLDRYCDLVLTGGVVNGVLYPGAMMELARQYRFKNIGGTSIGAAAAALTAAAEYARRYGSNVGFDEVIRNIPDELAEAVTFADPIHSGTRLRSLFQATSGMDKLLNLFVEFIRVADSPAPNASKMEIKTFFRNLMNAFFLAYIPSAMAKAMLSRYGVICALVAWVMVDAGQGLLPQGHALWGAWLIGWGACFLGLFAFSCLQLLDALQQLWRDIATLAKQNTFGICSGVSQKADNPAFMDWLHTGIQGAARLPKDRPLTFGDLWRAPNGPADSAKSIDLRMITTALGHGRPYELPNTDKSARLFFLIEEWQDLFPPEVLAFLQHKSRPYENKAWYAPKSASVLSASAFFEASQPTEPIPRRHLDGQDYVWLQQGGHLKPVERRRLLELPVGDLPVIVAVRMSMAVPFLFQSVPLWAIDNRQRFSQCGPGCTEPIGLTFNRVLFVDGGLTMNFPVHLFDAPIPRWPTFGIYLDEERRYEQKARRRWPYKENTVQKSEEPTITVPQYHNDFRTTGEQWTWRVTSNPRAKFRSGPAANASSIPTPSIFQYLIALFYTAKDWPQTASLRMPGIRERVVTVSLKQLTQGGFNLNMSGYMIKTLGNSSGVKAGKALIDRYLHEKSPLADPTLQGAPGWRDHRWIRTNLYLSALKEHLKGFSKAVHAAPYSDNLLTQIRSAVAYPPLKHKDYCETALSGAQADALGQALVAIEALEQALEADAVVQPYQANPQPEMRIRPRT